jgi:HSP90 family molecular chaperone
VPEYLRFVTGVVDSEDLPLSVSRESMKDQRLLRNLNAVLTKRILRWLSGTFVLVKQVL